MSSTWDSLKTRTRKFSVDSIISRLSPTKSLNSSRANSPTKSIMNIPPPLPSEPHTAEAIKIKLSDMDLIYENSGWRVEGTEFASSQMLELTDRNRILEGENQLLRFKMSYLLDLVATTKLDALQLEAERNS